MAFLFMKIRKIETQNSAKVKVKEIIFSYNLDVYLALLL